MDKLKADAARQIRNLFPDAGIRQVEKAVKQCYIGLVVAINTNERIKKTT